MAIHKEMAGNCIAQQVIVGNGPASTLCVAWTNMPQAQQVSAIYLVSALLLLNNGTYQDVGTQVSTRCIFGNDFPGGLGPSKSMSKTIVLSTSTLFLLSYLCCNEQKGKDWPS